MEPLPHQVGEDWIIDSHGTVLKHVHLRQDCDNLRDAVPTCVLHAPTDHHMRSWLLNWRQDRHIFERICEHGVGHPDPDQFAFWEYTHGEEDAGFMGVHGCDGCCASPRLCSVEGCYEARVATIEVKGPALPDAFGIEPDVYELGLCLGHHNTVFDTPADAYTIARKETT
jgi:hypothetical protein